MSFPKYPAYKDSGVEWLGEVPAHWSITPLKFSASCNDTVLPESTDDDYEIEYVEISDVNEMSGITGSASYKFSDAPSRARRMLQDGDVLISTVRTYLRAIAPVVNPPENLIASTGFAVVRPRKGILDGAFLGYLLRAEWWISEVIARSVGVSYPAINASDLIGLNIPVPALQEQTQIARFLDHETARIDALIEEQQRLIELLKEKRQAVISHAVTKGLDPTVPMKDSGVEWLGEVPAHWEVSKFGYISAVVRGGSPRPAGDPELFNGDYSPWVTVAEITKDEEIYLSETETFLTRKGSVQCRVFSKGTLLLSNSGATLGVPKILTMNANANDGVVGFENISLDKEYSYFYLSTLTQGLRERAAGSGQPNLNTDIIKSIDVPIPPQPEVAEIVVAVKKLREQFHSLSKTAADGVRLLQERRSALISAAVTGKIDVRNWQPPAGQYPAGDTQNRTEPEVA